MCQQKHNHSTRFNKDFLLWWKKLWNNHKIKCVSRFNSILPLWHHHLVENGGIIINIYNELWKASTMWWFEEKKDDQRDFIFAITQWSMILLINCHESAGVGAEWYDVFTLYKLNQILFFVSCFSRFRLQTCLMIGWWMLRCNNNRLIDVKRVTCTTLLNYACAVMNACPFIGKIP